MNTKNKKANPKISVIITCYNYGKFIDEAIESVQQQSFKDWELIIIDDCSTDKFTKDKIKHLSTNYPNLKIITLKENVGVSKARNLATKQARGEYILYLDADDYLAKDCLEKMYNKTLEGYDVIGCGLTFFNEKGVIKRSLPKPFDKENVISGKSLFPISFLYKKDFFELTKGFKENIIGEHSDFIFNLIKHNANIFVLQESLLFYRKHGKSRDDKLSKKHHKKAVLEKKKNYPEFYSKTQKINIFICQPEMNNLGDSINALIISKILNKKVSIQPIKKAEIIGIGSVLQLLFSTNRSSIFLRYFKPLLKYLKPKAYIWSSGFMREFENPNKIRIKKRFEVVAIRGKLSRNILESIINKDLSCVPLGDGGLLACNLLDKMPKKRFKLGIIPHYVDCDNLNLLNKISDLIPQSTIINIQGDILITLKKMAECEIIISSAMHGLIIADSLGVPNQWIRFSDKVAGGDFKFKDYYSVYNIKPQVWDLRHKEITKEDIENIPKNYKIKQEDITIIKNDLINSLKNIYPTQTL